MGINEISFVSLSESEQFLLKTPISASAKEFVYFVSGSSLSHSQKLVSTIKNCQKQEFLTWQQM